MNIHAAIDTHVEIEMIELAFNTRQPDALDRAERLRDRLVVAANAALEKAELQTTAVSAGADTRRAKGRHESGFLAFVHEQRAAAEAAGTDRPSLTDLAASFQLSRNDDAGDIVDMVASSARHLERATELTAAASNVGELIERHANKRLRDENLKDEKGQDAPGPTTETLYHLVHAKGGDAVLRLRAMNKLTDDHVRSAREIEAVQRFITSGIGLKVQRFAVKSGEGQDQAERHMSYAEHQAHMAMLHAQVYTPWTRGAPCREHRLADAVTHAVMVMLVVDGHSLTDVARSKRMRKAKALQQIVSSLDRYAKLRQDYRRSERGQCHEAAV